MHVVVEPSDYVLRNAGDMAMQDVAVRRVAALWPDATIHVLTDAPEELPRYAPGVRPLHGRGRRSWLTRTLPPGAGLRQRLRGTWARWRGDRRAPDDEEREFVQLVSSAALVVVSGMGGITDVFADYAGGVLRTLDLAAQHGVATAMMGQGLGPLRDGPLRRLAAIVLPRVDLIALREARAGAPLLRALGVSPARVVTTGDDAIEVAYRLATPDLGGDLGINLRRSDYAGVDTALVEALAPALARSAQRHAAMLVGLPISRVPGEEDAVTIAALRGDPGNPSDREPLALPALLERIRRCRVVVTGSYHAGVFALASGIPVVALARSPYYVDKFDGLADQFGDGCAVVRLDADGVAGRLEAAIEQSWARAGDLRPALLGAAARQIELGHAAYRRLATLVRPGPLAAR